MGIAAANKCDQKAECAFDNKCLSYYNCIKHEEPPVACMFQVHQVEQEINRAFLWASFMDEDEANKIAQQINGIVVALPIVTDHRKPDPNA